MLTGKSKRKKAKKRTNAGGGHRMEKLGEEACGVAKEVQVLWTEERRTLTLCSEPVLEYTLSWPRVEGAGLGGRWISGYYARLAQSWRRRW